MSKTPLIRQATDRDEAEWRSLWHGFLEYYAQPLLPEVADRTWARLMSPTSPLSCRVAIRDGLLSGFAIHQTHPSTWVMGDDCYLEDLYVTPQARGTGVGTALIEDLIALARSRGCKRLHWLTEPDNRAARALYDKYADVTDHIRYRINL